jgi:hypothetical protein
MSLYAVLFAAPFCWWAGNRFAPAGSLSRRAMPFVIGLGLTLFLGLRHHVGGDWHSYWLMFERGRAYELPVALAISDPAYMALNILVGRAGLEIGIVNLICAAILIAGTVAFSMGRPAPWLALTVATPVLILVMGMTTTRQSVAVGLELLAFAWWLGGRRIAPSAALLLACAFHWSAIVLLPLAGLVFLRDRWRRMTLHALAALAALALVFAWAFVDPGTPSAGAAFRLVPSVLALALLVVARRRFVWAGSEGTIVLYLAGLALFCLAILPLSSLAADRLGYYTIALQMLVLPAAAEAAGKSAGLGTPLLRRRLAALAVVGLSLLLFAGWALAGHYTACMVPYRSYLQAPALLWESEGLTRIC